MQIQQDLHSYLNDVKKTSSLRLPAIHADPFALLSTFVLGTGDLFDTTLQSQINIICAAKDVKGYVELASTIDSYTKNYVTDDVELVKGHRVLCSMLKKYPFSTNETPYDTRATAILKWRAAETQCGETNARLHQNKVDGDFPSFIAIAKRLIADCLGDLSTDVIMKILAAGEHGKGTSTECPFVASTVYHKYKSTTLYSTRKAKNYAKAAISLNRRWYHYLDGCEIRTKVPFLHSSPAYVESQLLDEVIAISDHERISFVEKDAKTMRPIGIGNTLNMYLQLGVKKILGEKLLKVGVDLTNQQKNQNMARMGSLVGSVGDGKRPEQYSTIDLASASDTVSIGICELLLPSDWFGLLCDLRHESGVLDDEVIVYNKMSAMGNGFTFPLESLLFWAIARATAEVKGFILDKEDLAVYGDDLICPLMFAPDLITNLEFSGFTVNSEKSFIQGSFKESCGADYYQGINVRPYYLKRRLMTVKDLYHVANAIVPRTLDKDCRVSRGYSAVYCFIAKTINELGSINYRPLSDIFAHDKSGRTTFHDSEFGLAVPFSYNCENGMGYMNTRSKVTLFNKKWFPRVSKDQRNAALSGYISCTLPYALRIVEKPKGDKDVVESLRLLTRLQSLSDDVDNLDQYSSHQEKFSIDPSGITRITVKGSPNTMFRLHPVPSWDGYASKGLLARHPVWMVA
jgi:hypothetical protein